MVRGVNDVDGFGEGEEAAAGGFWIGGGVLGSPPMAQAVEAQQRLLK